MSYAVAAGRPCPRATADFGLAITAFALLAFWKLPPWLVVVLTALGGWAVAAVPGMI